MKKIYLALILFLLVMVVGCGKETEQKKNPYFQATVLEVKENSILVEPFEGEQELTSVDRISVSTDVISIQEVPEMEEGTEVRVVYNGEIAESYPAQIHHVFAIYLIDENGEVIIDLGGSYDYQTRRDKRL